MPDTLRPFRSYGKPHVRVRRDTQASALALVILGCGTMLEAPVSHAVTAGSQAMSPESGTRLSRLLFPPGEERIVLSQPRTEHDAEGNELLILPYRRTDGASENLDRLAVVRITGPFSVEGQPSSISVSKIWLFGMENTLREPEGSLRLPVPRPRVTRGLSIYYYVAVATQAQERAGQGEHVSRRSMDFIVGMSGNLSETLAASLRDHQSALEQSRISNVVRAY